MKLYYALLASALAVGTLAGVLHQDLTTFHGCGPNGSATRGIELEENPLKNRWQCPPIDPSITYETLYNASVTAGIDQNSGVTIQGYVVGVKPGDRESCNCGSTVDLDTHILVSPTAGGDPHHVLIVEVTPRTRSLNPQWTQSWLKQNLLGHLVQFTGGILNDEEHKVSSSNDNVRGTRNWRQTCYEVHPVTGIQVLR